MGRPSMTRAEFLRTATFVAAGTLTSGGSAAASQSGTPCSAGAARAPLVVRPYRLLCLVCALGDGPDPKDPKLKELLEAIRRDPDRPLSLCCNAGDVYCYQDPGTADDTPEGPDYNRKRDLDILRRLDAAPGATHPARIWLARLLREIPTVAGLCGYSQVTSPAWRGCALAASGSYERGHKKGLEAIIPPCPEGELAREKEVSIKALNEAREVTVRPHILVCSVCQYGGGTRPPFKPDNLPELLQLVLTKRPDVPIKLVRGADWMMCAPCPSRVAGLNACVCGRVKSGGLYNEVKDLNVLQQLGLTYGTTMKARDLYRLIFEKIPTVTGVCALDVEGKAESSIWRDGCGGKPHPAYDKGRKELMAKLEVRE